MSDQAIETAFAVILHTDGTFRVELKLPEEKLEVQRNATQYDVIQISNQVIKEIEAQDLTNRILAGIIQILSASQEASPADRVKEKLKERGIHPDEGQNPVN